MELRLHQYSRDKNETDLELAIQHALDAKPEQIIIVAALGGRLDQTLANLALISDIRFVQLDVRLDDGVEEVFFCRDQVQVQGKKRRYRFVDPVAGRGDRRPHGKSQMAASQ